jgi:hypothetical protein
MKMSEKQFQNKIWNLAQRTGWKVAHFPPSRNQRGGHQTAVAYDAKGWPDLVLCHPGRGLFLIRELKVKPNKLTPEQTQWLADLGNAEIDGDVWYPEDWDGIVALLKGTG